MRISLLLQREPFGEIFEKTVAGFLEAKIGSPVVVRWISGRPNIKKLKREGYQIWLCNPYLNAIFVETAKSDVFEPVCREFSRSTQWWRRPLQRLYVEAAIRPISRAHLAQAVVAVSPFIPCAEHYLFIGGNHKIRLLDSANRTVYGVLKADFPTQSIRREIAARQYAARLGLPVPTLQEVAVDGTWFREEYVIGTPLNRLSGKQQEDAAAEAFRVLQRVWSDSEEEICIPELASQYLTLINSIAEGMPLLNDAARMDVERTAEHLFQYIERLAVQRPYLYTTLTHGDFQPANILVNRQGVWLIDWEHADRRIAGYDELVFSLQARFPTGLATRLERWVKTGAATWEHDTRWGNKYSIAERHVIAAIFLLEELIFQLNTNSSPQLIHLGRELSILLSEGNAWLHSYAGTGGR